MSNQSKAHKSFSHRVAICCFALFAVALFASACLPSEASPYDDAMSARATATTASGGGELASPLLDLIGVPLANDEAIEDYYNELYAQAERQITECMAAQGFDYTPLDYSQLDLNADPIMETREYAEEFGFGVTSLEERADVPAGMIQDFEDPNAGYLDTLDAGEYEAFDIALHGDREGGEPSGCQHDAFEEAFAFIPVFEDFGYDYQEIQAAVAADPRIVEAQSQWAVCMAEAGYNYADRADAEAAIQERLASLLSDPGAFAGDSLRPETQRQLDTLAAEERAIAVAGWECTQPINELKRSVERDYEQRFVNEHGAAISEALGK